GVLAAATGGLLMYGRSRRLLVAWVWCAISRHRLRTCFATFIRANRRGSLPLILVAWPVPAGERVLLVLRPGLAVDDLTTDDALARLAVGWWAREVRVRRASGRFAPSRRQPQRAAGGHGGLRCAGEADGPAGPRCRGRPRPGRA